MERGVIGRETEQPRLQLQELTGEDMYAQPISGSIEKVN